MATTCASPRHDGRVGIPDARLADAQLDPIDPIDVRFSHVGGQVDWSITNRRAETIAVFAYPRTFEWEWADTAWTEAEGDLLVLKKTVSSEDPRGRIPFPEFGLMLAPGESMSGKFQLANPVVLMDGEREGEKRVFSRAVMEVGWLLDPAPKVECTHSTPRKCDFSDETLRTQRLVRSRIMPF